MADQMNTNNPTSTPRRRSLFSKVFGDGSQLASQRDLDGIRERSSTGFSTTAAKIDDAWGCHALTETGFTEVGFSEREQEKSNSSELVILKNNNNQKYKNASKM
ncbi:unnamed protein product [Cunninghamella blakesleeana]